MTPPLVVCDASVCLKWFHEDGEEGVAAARSLLARRDEAGLELAILDLTAYEIGNALVRGRRVAPEAVSTVLGALAEIVPTLSPTPDELALTASIAARHDLTFYDGAYAAVAQGRGGILATFDRQLLAAGLGVRPSEAAEAR